MVQLVQLVRPVQPVLLVWTGTGIIQKPQPSMRYRLLMVEVYHLQ